MQTILITTPWFYPAFKAGGPVQSIVNMVQALDEVYDFLIFTSDTDLHKEPLKGIKTSQWVRFNSHTKVWYAPKQNRSNELLQLVKDLKPDLVYMIGLYDWHFTLVPLFFIKGPARLLSVRGMLHPGALAEKTLKKKLFLLLMQLLQLNNRTAFHASDVLERGHVQQRLGEQARVHEAGNFARNIGALNLPVKEPDQLKLVSIALVSPMKNILLVLEALQHCDENICYDIYGPVKDAVYWAVCQEQRARLPQNISVKHHGELSSFYLPQALEKSQVFILPSKSENFGHSIYEALSAGLPVITSGFTPWNGLEEQQAGCNVANDVAAIRQAIRMFAAMQQESFVQWQQGALRLAKNSMDVELLRRQYDEMFTSATKTYVE